MYILNMSRKIVSIPEAAGFFGACPQTLCVATLRRWEREGWLLPDERTLGGRYRFHPESAPVRPDSAHFRRMLLLSSRCCPGSGSSSYPVPDSLFSRPALSFSSGSYPGISPGLHFGLFSVYFRKWPIHSSTEYPLYPYLLLLAFGLDSIALIPYHWAAGVMFMSGTTFHG